MAAVSLKFTGGKAALKQIQAIAKQLSQGGSVNVGFLENARYSDTHPTRGTKRKPIPVAQAAFWNEFGTKRAPPRPFFRNAIARNSPQWGIKMGKIAVGQKYDSGKTLGLMGMLIKGEIQQSINQLVSPPLSPRTIAIKGFDKPLIDDATMVNNVDSEVKKS